MPDDLQIGDRIRVNLDSGYWRSRGWFEGSVVQIQPYSNHRRFYWIELDLEVELAQGGRTRLISVLNPRKLEKI